MPFVSGNYTWFYGTSWFYYLVQTFCINDTSNANYGKCYNRTDGKIVFVQTDTTTWPIDPTTGDSFPCAKDGTCTRYTYTTGGRYFGTVFSYSGKQAIVQYVYSRSHSSCNPFRGNIANTDACVVVPTPNDRPDDFWVFPSPNYEYTTWPVYDPVVNLKLYLNPYSVPYGNVAVLRWQGSFFATYLSLWAFERGANNIWYASDGRIFWVYESSPLAIIPLDYGRDYVPYQELRNAFGYAATGVDQPGWNADDMIRVLRELFPDRAWAVFDDRQYVLYLYNLTPDYVPDWLIEKLAPTAMKVLQSPADATVAKAWLDLLNERNAQIPPQAELP